MNKTFALLLGIAVVALSVAFLNYLLRAMRREPRPDWLRSTVAGDFATVTVVVLFVAGIGLITNSALH